MFSHVSVGTNDLDASKRFYDALLGALGHQPGEFVEAARRTFWRTPTGLFASIAPIDGKPATICNGGTIGFAATSIAQGEAGYAAAIAHGGTACEDPPGIRERNGLWLAYMRDPDGNKLCIMHKPE